MYFEQRYIYHKPLIVGGCRKGGKSAYVVTSHFHGIRGTVPAGGVRILEINIESRSVGFRIVIKTDEVTITVDIP